MLSVKGLAAEAMPDARWDLRRVRSELKARYALVGEVRQSGSSRRIEARLLDTASNTVVWGDSFEVPPHMANASLDIAAKRITAALRDKIVDLEISRLAKAPPKKPDAMDYSLLAFAEANARSSGWLNRADELLKQALVVNPRFVPALVGRAELLAFRRSSSSDERERAEIVREIDRLTLAAVTADPECAASWTTRASILAAMGQLDAAFASADKAVRLNPANAWAVSERMDLLIAAGRARDAILPLDEVTLIYEKRNLADFMRLQCLARVYASQLEDAPKACESWYALGGDAAALEALASVYGSSGEAEKAVHTVGALLKAVPNATIGTIRKGRQPVESAFPVLASQAESTFYAGLRRASFPE